MLVAPALAGCATEQTPAPSQTAAATDAPVFASDEEALAAATKAYASYQELSSVIAQEGGVSPERIAEFATGAALKAEVASFSSLARAELRGVGQLAFDSAKLQEVDLASGSVRTYLCLDVSDTDVVDAVGESAVPSDRVLRFPLQVGFVHDPLQNRLLVEESKSWSGNNFC